MHPESQPYRVAIYYAPDTASADWHMGSEWLGRCAATGEHRPQTVIDGIAADLFAKLTAHPRRYGWHATLKAPFQLAAGNDLNALRSGARRICQGRRPFDLPAWRLSTLDGFLSLRPEQSPFELAQFAADCVQQLHNFAAPLSESELARRRLAPLSHEEDALLLAWGYPYVLQHFQFHLSLTGSLNLLPSYMLPALMQAANSHFQQLPAAHIDRLSIFIEPRSGEDFQLLEQILFTP